MHPIDLDRTDPDASDFVVARVRGAYEDPEPLGLGEVGLLDPGGEIFTEDF